MEIFQKDSDYAVRVLLYLATQEAGSVSDTTSKLSMNSDYISTTDLATKHVH